MPTEGTERVVRASNERAWTGLQAAGTRVAKLLRRSLCWVVPSDDYDDSSAKRDEATRDGSSTSGGETRIERGNRT